MPMLFPNFGGSLGTGGEPTESDPHYASTVLIVNLNDGTAAGSDPHYASTVLIVNPEDD